MSGQFVKTVGFLGKTHLTPMTKPVSIRIGNRETKIPLLVCRNTPVNLLGRDAILGLELKLDCTKQGIDVSGMYKLGVEKGDNGLMFNG